VVLGRRSLLLAASGLLFSFTALRADDEELPTFESGSKRETKEFATRVGRG
jgi:hypothetical protein